MEKRFIKLGDKFYVVEMQANKGLVLIPATADDVLTEQFEVATLLDGDANNVGNDNFLQQVIDSTKEEMVESLKHGLKKTVLRSLGFSESSWGKGGFQVDHCNGRMNEVTSHISVTLKQILRDVTVEELAVTEAERAELIAAMRKDVLKEYQQKLRYGFWEMVHKIANEDAKKVAESLIKERSEQVGAIVLNQLFNTIKKV